MEYAIRLSEDHIITSLLHCPAPNFRYKLVAKNLSMASYLLLRNNKESGPYSLEALIQLGLKPYDLVWVEGRSAAWRYPSEVEDLKFYAPVVEEQPFDRFFKKPSEQKKEREEPKPAMQEVVQQTITETQPEKIKEIVIEKEPETIEVKTSKKQVYVSMPANGGRTVIIKKTEQVAAAASTNGNGSLNDTYSKNQETLKKSDSTVSSSPSYTELVSDYNKQQYAEKKVPVQQTPLPADDYPLEKKYSQSLDDIKDMYVQTLADRKRKNAQKKIIMNVAKKVLPFAAVLVIGILTGVFIMNTRSGKEPASQTQQARIPIQNDATEKKPDVNATSTRQQVPPQTEPDQQQVAENNPTDLSKSATVQKDNIITDPQNGLSPSANAKKPSKKENKTNVSAGANTNETTQPKNIEPDPVTGERNKVVRSDNDNNAQPATKQLSNALMKQVSVASNEYKRGTFGGIHDLQLTVTNNSNYLLDNVVVELQILKPNEQPLTTDNIRFSPVPPNGSLTLGIPATSRGVKVAYRVTHVESKSAVNDTAGLK